MNHSVSQHRHDDGSFLLLITLKLMYSRLVPRRGVRYSKSDGDGRRFFLSPPLTNRLLNPTQGC